MANASSSPQTDLLAPVPFKHLLAAEAAGMTEQVAFGSEKAGLFSGLGQTLQAGMRVWLYASLTGSEQIDPGRLQRVCFTGEFGGSTETGTSYASLACVRPPGTEAESWGVLWLVRNFTAIRPRFVQDFTSASTLKSLTSPPRGPILIVAEPL